MADHTESTLNEGREMPYEAISAAAKPETYETSEPRVHLLQLNALRGIFALDVVWTHLTSHWQRQMGSLTIPLLDVDVDIQQLIQLRSVPLFFLLTGYLLAWTEGKRAKRGSYSLRSYALRRVLRIVPACYVAILVAVLAWPNRASLSDVLSHMLFIHGFSPQTAKTIVPPMWSLTPVVAFCFLLPLIILKLPRLWQRLVLFAALFLAFLLAQLYYEVGYLAQAKYYASYLNPLAFLSSYLYLFMAGVLLRALVERLNKRPVGSPLQTRVASALFLVSVSYIAFAPPLGLTQAQQAGPRVLIAVTQDLVVIAFFASALLGAPILRGLLRWRLLGFVGTISYSLYLFHAIVARLADVYVLRNTRGLLDGLDDLAIWPIFCAYVLGIFVVSGAIAYLSYRYVESPFLRIKPK